MIDIELSLIEQGLVYCGIDEAGAGPLCGDVLAAAVVLHPDRPIPGLDDSKKLTEKRRQIVYEQILESAVDYAIARATVAEIDDINILNARMLAMTRAVAGLSASVLAKVTRDREMLALDKVYPGYGFAQHKGYGTKVHLQALHTLGPCAIHRRSYAPVRALLESDSTR